MRLARTLSSPMRVRMSGPVTEMKSPMSRSFTTSQPGSARSLTRKYTCSFSPFSAMWAKMLLPISRMAMTRPMTLTTWGAASSCSLVAFRWASRMSTMPWVRSALRGQTSRPRAWSFCSFSTRAWRYWLSCMEAPGLKKLKSPVY